MHRHQSSNSRQKSSDNVSRETNLASKLCDEDVKAESVVIVGKVVDEILGRSTIIVKSESVKLGKQIVGKERYPIKGLNRSRCIRRRLRRRIASIVSPMEH